MQGVIKVKTVSLYGFMRAYAVLYMTVKEFAKQLGSKSKQQSLFIESFQLTLNFHSFIPSNMKSTCRIFNHN